ncbi:hypothetical protein Tco_1047032 [Tanacetum coccineum]
MFWHTATDDPMFTTIRVISKHQDTQIYGAILPQHLTNQAMLKSEAYKTYHAYATGDKIPKPKYVKNKVNPESSPKKKSAQASKGKRLKTSTKVAKPAKKKQHATTSKAKGLNVLSEVALSETEQMKLATKKSKTQFHSSQASGSGVDEGTGVSPGVPDVPTYNSKDKQISWKSSDEDNDDEANMSENDDQNDENVDNEEIQDKEDNEEEWSDNEAYDEETQGGNDEKERMDEEETNKEEEANELYRDVNVNLEGRDTAMTDALSANVQTTQVIKDTHVMINVVTPEVQQQSSSVSSSFISNMLNPNPDISIDSILNLNTESTSLADVPITTNAEMPPLSFEDRVKALEDNFSEFIQINSFTEVVSSIPSIVDKYLANQMNEAIKAGVQLQSDRLREEAQAENEEFINKFDENMKKIFKEQTKMESNKSIHRSDEQKNLYKALVEAYESDKLILDTYGDTVSFKRRRDDEDKDKEPSARSNRGSKRRRARKEPESTNTPKEKIPKSTSKSTKGSKSLRKSTGESAHVKEPMHIAKDLEELAHQEFETGATKDQPVDETPQPYDWF